MDLWSLLYFDADISRTCRISGTIGLETRRILLPRFEILVLVNKIIQFSMVDFLVFYRGTILNNQHSYIINLTYAMC